MVFFWLLNADYDTPDGTGVRDYIHVVDLAKAHVAAVDHGALSAEQWHGCRVYNIGCGKGYSVLDMVRAFEKASGRPIPYQFRHILFDVGLFALWFMFCLCCSHRIVARRPGDIGTCYANPEKAKAELHWEAQANIDDMCADAWRWQSNNPYGYDEAPAQ
jgi:UDP-glucose 4-epimerase